MTMVVVITLVSAVFGAIAVIAALRVIGREPDHSRRRLFIALPAVVGMLLGALGILLSVSD